MDEECGEYCFIGGLLKKARNAIIPRERGCTSQKISIVYSKEVEFCLGVGYSIKLKTWKPLNFDRTVL